MNTRIENYHIINLKKTVFLILLINISVLHAQLPEDLSITSVADSVYQKELHLKELLQEGDTLQTIRILIELGSIHSHKAQFALSYEHLWNALLMTTQVNDSASLVEVYDQLGWLYSFYDRPEEALKYYYSALVISKQLLKSNPSQMSEIIPTYYGIAILYREQGNMSMFKSYIDSCSMYLDSFCDGMYVKAEVAYYHLLNNEHDTAITIMEEIESWFLENDVSYFVILYKFLGDAYLAANKKTISEMYYKKALDYVKTYDTHVNYIPKIYEGLADLYFDKGNIRKAYTCLQSAKDYDDILFDSRSINNRSLLEISDKFKQEQESRRELIQKQRIIELEHQKRVSLYRNLIILIVLISIVVLAYLGRRSTQLKYKAEKKLEIQKLELEQAKNNELLESKNKELAFTALQLVEKDKFLKDLKKKLLGKKELPDKEEISKIYQSISLNVNQNWKSFEARFIETNNDFYSELIKLCPNLTPGELKLCALIKLNFSSKEIANLLAVGTDSVHTLRHRLRKKIGLSRSDNITKFLNSLN